MTARLAALVALAVWLVACDGDSSTDTAAEFCDLAESVAALQDIDVTDRDVVGEGLELLGDLAAAAPDDIADDVAVFEALMAAFAIEDEADALAAASDLPDGEEVFVATQRLDAFAADECGLDVSLTGIGDDPESGGDDSGAAGSTDTVAAPGDDLEAEPVGEADSGDAEAASEGASGSGSEADSDGGDSATGDDGAAPGGDEAAPGDASEADSGSRASADGGDGQAADADSDGPDSDGPDADGPDADGPDSNGPDADGPVAFGDDPFLDELYESCRDGDLVDCDELYFASGIGSEYEAFGSTCGETSEATRGACADGTLAEGIPDTYGDDPELDGLWEDCDDGDATACDNLYSFSPIGSAYEEFGSTCGGRYEPFEVACTDALDG